MKRRKKNISLDNDPRYRKAKINEIRSETSLRWVHYSNLACGS